MNPKNWKPGRWALLTVGLYAATLVALTFPLLLACLSKDLSQDIDIEIFRSWEYWIIISVLSLIEGFALFFPVAVSRQRPVKRRSWALLAVTSGLMFGLLLATLSFSISEVRTTDFFKDAIVIPAFWWAVGAGLLGWLFWGLFFWLTSRKSDEYGYLRRIRTYLLAGSIAELLVAVPSHIYVRQRTDCCAGFGTFLGIATGFVVMTFAFGPGVFFLFAERVAALQRAQDAEQISRSTGILQSHGKDTVMWTALAITFVCLPNVTSVITQTEAPAPLVSIARISFYVMSAASCISAVRAWRKRNGCGD